MWLHVESAAKGVLVVVEAEEWGCEFWLDAVNARTFAEAVIRASWELRGGTRSLE